MASFFQSFRSSSMAKQLLRFALSRLDLLDTQALDLENLDFALGRNTVLEFRDVGLVLQKLERLLGLPPTFSLQKAKVLVLRVTIPMDFYTSPITAEVDGVDIRLKVASKKEKDGQNTGKRGTAGPEAVPTAADLAQSFLETQPVAEKKELEQALAAETQDLAASMAASGSESDDDLTVGTGQTLSLPAFLTDFLQGIVDRIQIRVQSVIFQVDVEVAVDPSSSVPELVTFQLSLDNINVEGVTSTAETTDEASAIVHKEGKRHILLDNIRAALITETNVFSSLARSTSMPSSVASRSPVLNETATFSPPGLARSVSSGSMASSDGLSQSQYPLQDSEAAFNIPYSFDNNDRGEADETSPLSTPRASVYRGSPPPTVRDHAKSAVLEPSPRLWSTAGREAQSEPFLRPPEGFSLSNDPSPAASVHSSSSGSARDDLAESHIYSHEDAESMYMSAFSQTGSQGLRTGMPCAWDAFEDAEEHETVTEPFTATRSALHEDGQAGDSLASPSQDHERDGPSFDAQEPSVEEPEPAQDDIPTPRGPTRLVKELLSLSSISVYLPSTHKHANADAPNLSKSISPNMPGAFSMYSAATTSPKLIPVNEPAAEETSVDPSIEIVLKPVDIQFDASIGFLLAMVVARLLEAAQGGSKDSVGPATAKPPPKSPDIKITVEQLSVLFLEKLAGVADVPHRLFEKRTTDLGSDVLLQAQLADIRGSLSNEGPQTEMNFSIEKLKFGYANDDIISFDRSVLMFESVANTFPSAGQDVSVKATMGPETSRLEVNTLPLHVKLDLQRLDEMFSWFGGLSSFLNMGASITANKSGADKTPAKPIQKPKGVRFDEPIHPDDRTVAKENKTDLRINGLRVDLIGKDCSVMLNTSALKLVSREEGLGVHLSRIRLSGPYLKNSRAEAPIVSEVLDTRAEFLSLPRAKDLERLIELITPSKVKFDEDEDEIMVDTLLRQRRKGSVLSLAIGKVRVDAGNLQQLTCLPSLVDDLARLGTVAKYLPEDDRPGLLTLCHVKHSECRVDVGGRFGAVLTSLSNLEVAHISMPQLAAVAVGEMAVTRNKIEELVMTSPPPNGTLQNLPVFMMRLIDDIEPVLKIKLIGLGLEYRVPTIMDVLNLSQDATPEDYEAGLAASVASLGEQAHTVIRKASSGSLASTGQAKASKSLKVDIAFRDCLIGLNPLALASKLTVVLTDAHLEMTPNSHDITAVTTMKRAAILLIDDTSILESPGARFASTRRPQAAPSPQVTELCTKGYVNICQISSAKATVTVSKDSEGDTQLEVEVRDDLLVLETCADSTQTLIALANALTPPTPPSKEIKYRTSVVPVEDLLASIRAEAFGQAEGDYDFDNDFEIAKELGDDADSDLDFDGGPSDSPLNLDSQYLEEGVVQEELFNATSDSILQEGGTKFEDTNDGVLLSTTGLDNPSSSGLEVSTGDLSIKDDYFENGPVARGTAHRWDSKANKYDQHNDLKLQRSPLKVCVRDVHVIWHLFDGYDWARTREVIAKAVQEVEAKAYERRTRTDRRGGYDQDLDEDETVIGDCLFNSIYIGIPANRDPKELAQAINHGLQDFGDTESIATSTATTSTLRTAGQRRRSKSLKLDRSKRHKITFELRGVNVDMVMFPPGSGETVNSLDIRLRDVDVFDHVPESTWKKFAMYDIDAGERELGASMVHAEIITTRPVDTPATEMVISATILPLRLHVDQDALDFITRFFTFRDETAPVHASPSDVPFIQRIVVNSVPVKLDFKPKRVDYAGLRSGKTTEFMNFMILEGARLVLRRVILYGVSGFDRLGDQLNDIWTADVKSNQLPGVLAGLAPVRSLVNAGSGFRDLIEIPIREYRKDGRIVRSLRKGATAFAKTTGTEVVKLGAKLAIGTQNALQGAEGLLAPQQTGEGSSSSAAAVAAVLGDDWDEEEYEEEVHRKISLYADQPLGIVQGVRGAYASLARDLSVARDAIIAVPAEVMDSQGAQGAAAAVLKKAPTIILRPAIGATKAIGQTLLGATNSLDPMHRRRVEAKYKKH